MNALNPLHRYGLKAVINAAGTMTQIGAARVVPEGVEAGAAVQSHFVNIDALQSRASGVIARLTGAEAGFVTACSAAGMSLSVAGAMTGPDLARIENLPDTAGMENQVLVQAGHLVNYGAPIEQSVRITGARVVPLGSAALVHDYHLESSIGEGTVAALFVVSHHVVQEGQIPLAEFIASCHACEVPVIVDAASEYDLRGPIALGADIVVYSSHKFLGGPTAGIVAGRADLVRAAYLQNLGIGRLMKVGKEGVVGAMAALEAWEQRDHAAVRHREQERLKLWKEALDPTPGLSTEIQPDWTGNPVDRLKVIVNSDEAGLFAWELADRLASADPGIHVRDDLVEHGYFHLDPCNLDDEEAVVVARRIVEEIETARRAGNGRAYTHYQRKCQTMAERLSWPNLPE